MRLLLLLASTVLLAACTATPTQQAVEMPPVYKPAQGTELADYAQRWQAEHGELSELLALNDGIDALGARLRMIDSAQFTIDAQYFLVKNDMAGKLFLQRLLAAADRGVKVRLLLDDIFTNGLDTELTMLDAHANIEVRLFNPLSRSVSKYFHFLFNFETLNRRMHHKSLVVDSAMAVVGGRNIADEYFQINRKVHFLDFDLLVVGSVIEDITAVFNQYWDSPLAVANEVLSKPQTEQALNRWRQSSDNSLQQKLTKKYIRAVNSDFLKSVIDGEHTSHSANTAVISDPPEKLSTPVGEQQHKQLVQELTRLAANAKREILIVTPYFVPRTIGADFIAGLAESGIRVVIVTNSLASTNHTAVHSGYARYRSLLLDAGVEFYELAAMSNNGDSGGNGAGNSGGNSDGNSSDRPATLHTKMMVFDQQTTYVGSYNFDPRSIDINSEMGLLITSSRIGSQAAQSIYQELPGNTYRPFINEDGKLRWLLTGTQSPVLKHEPQAGFWRRFSSGFYRLLPIEDQL